LARKKQNKKPGPSNDEIRWQILKLLYDERVESGLRTRYLWSELRMKVRNGLGYSPPETAHNLEYLIQSGWIEKQTEPYTGPRSHTFGTQKELYSISAKAVDLFEEGSVFSSSPPVNELVIAGDYNIVQVGPNTYAYAPYQDLQSALLRLIQGVFLSEDLSPGKKVEAIADIKAIQAQLLKAEPEKTFLNKLKEGVSFLANVAGLTNLAMNVLQHWPF